MISRKTVAAVMASILVAGTLSVAYSARKSKAAAPQKASKAAASVAAENIVDSLDTMVGWEIYTDNGSKVTLSSVEGKAGKAIQAAYEFGTGGWVAFNKVVNSNMADAKTIKLYVKGSGALNSLEIKLEDGDGTNFGFLFPIKSNVESWSTVEIPVSQLKYWWGGNPELDWAKIVRFHFAISKKDGDEGGNGKVVFDQIELVK